MTVAAAKCMALILPLLIPQHPRGRLFKLGVGLLAPSVLLSLGAVGQMSLRRKGGDDCLGYTVFATVSATTDA